MSKYLALLPAYGRRYNSAAEIKADWYGHGSVCAKDFKILGGPYCSSRDIEQLKKAGYTGIAIAYSRRVLKIEFN